MNEHELARLFPEQADVILNRKPKRKFSNHAKVKAIATQRKKLGEMNKTEAAYYQHLQNKLQSGEIHLIKYEAIKLRLADKTYYNPDFLVVLADMTIELHEVKGSWKAPHQEDARVKIKVAAEQFPEFQFAAFVKDKGSWTREDF